MAPEATTESKQEPKEAKVAPQGLILPGQIISQADIVRISREMEEVNEFFLQAEIRAANAKNLPQTTQQLGLLVEENKLNLLQAEDREKLKKFIDLVKTKAPVVHASFATDPKPDFLMKLVTWFRTEAHPLVLLHIGLQPNIAAGCIIRTTNKYFDFSFLEHFKKSKLKLIATMRNQT